jgi:hypothetical protein
MFRAITSVLLLGLLLGTHTVLDVCGIRYSSQLRGHHEALSTAAVGMQGMAHCAPATQTAAQPSIGEGCVRAHCSQAELAFVANQRRGLIAQTLATLPCSFLSDSPSPATLIEGFPRQRRSLLLQTSSSPESILNIRV